MVIECSFREREREGESYPVHVHARGGRFGARFVFCVEKEEEEVLRFFS